MSPSDADRAAQARAIIDSSLYLVLATSDSEGTPTGVSREARHSINIPGRATLRIVI